MIKLTEYYYDSQRSRKNTNREYRTNPTYYRELQRLFSLFLEIYIKNLTKNSHFNFLKNFIVKATLFWEKKNIYIYIYLQRNSLFFFFFGIYIYKKKKPN